MGIVELKENDLKKRDPILILNVTSTTPVLLKVQGCTLERPHVSLVATVMVSQLFAE